MVGPTDILTSIQNGVVALNNLGSQVKGSFNNILGQLTTLNTFQATPYSLIGLTRVLSVASGNVSYTGVGFKPRLILFLNGISGGSGWGSIGQAFSGSNTCLEINSGTNNQVFYQGSFAGVQRDDATGVNFQSYIVLSYNADGFTLTWTKSGTPTATASVNALCFR